MKKYLLVFKKKLRQLWTAVASNGGLQRDIENSKLKFKYHYFYLTPKKNLMIFSFIFTKKDDKKIKILLLHFIIYQYYVSLHAETEGIGKTG